MIISVFLNTLHLVGMNLARISGVKNLAAEYSLRNFRLISMGWTQVKKLLKAKLGGIPFLFQSALCSMQQHRFLDLDLKRYCRNCGLNRHKHQPINQSANLLIVECITRSIKQPINNQSINQSTINQSIKQQSMNKSTNQQLSKQVKK